ncbi:MAG: 1-deoxy-D-xylulose-5-phosphate reductoisomerase [Acidobacteriota bacterium]|nr:1-deoxy-D-xylulose-5-phosphate reductoisomerase [Acidobacteriota bacterium]
MPRPIAILGSTGSIGRNTLEVVEAHPGRFEVVALVAGRRMERLAEQIRRHRPRAVAVSTEEAARELRSRLGGQAPEMRIGPEGAAEVTVGTGAEVVIAGIVGAAGLVPTLAAVSAGLVVGLANKEALVIAGELMVRAARDSGARLLPVDSEHNAIHQCLRAGERGEVRRIVLTASGGPFRGQERGQLESVSLREALDHPTWKMGPKITIDSATLMNKGLEVIEAHWLFALPPQAIDVVVHPQSVVHSMVEFRDGSVVAQLGCPDMKHPIQYALTWPERWESAGERLDLLALPPLAFEAPDVKVFRCLDLAYRVLAEGGDAPARLNAANEVAVEAFLDGRIGFLQIPDVIEGVLGTLSAGSVGELEDVLEADRRAREEAQRIIAEEMAG